MRRVHAARCGRCARRHCGGGGVEEAEELGTSAERCDGESAGRDVDGEGWRDFWCAAGRDRRGRARRWAEGGWRRIVGCVVRGDGESRARIV